MKIIITSLLIITGILTAGAISNNEYLNHRDMVVSQGKYEPNIKIVKFIDPDNGNVCYVTPVEAHRAGTGISCLKP